MLEFIQKRIAQKEPQLMGEKERFAVLLPLVWVDDQWQILYQVRSQQVSQPGEVSFPGGRLERGETYEVAAIRETMEELGLPQEAIQLLGEIDYMVVGQRVVHCFVGKLAISDWQQIRPNQEVERLFTVPLKDLMEHPPVYYHLLSRVDLTSDFPFERIPKGRNYPFPPSQRAIPFYEEVPELLWGLTAQFTHCFVERLQTKDNSPF